jgi:hypothetical protein
VGDVQEPVGNQADIELAGSLPLLPKRRGGRSNSTNERRIARIAVHEFDHLRRRIARRHHAEDVTIDLQLAAWMRSARAEHPATRTPPERIYARSTKRKAGNRHTAPTLPCRDERAPCADPRPTGHTGADTSHTSASDLAG